MRDDTKFHIDGAWLDATSLPTLDVINPATEKIAGRIALGTAADVDHAVAAAKAAFRNFSRTTRQERLDLLQSVLRVDALP